MESAETRAVDNSKEHAQSQTVTLDMSRRLQRAYRLAWLKRMSAEILLERLSVLGMPDLPIRKVEEFWGGFLEVTNVFRQNLQEFGWLKA